MCFNVFGRDRVLVCIRTESVVSQYMLRSAGSLIVAMLLGIEVLVAQMVSGKDIPEFASTFGITSGTDTGVLAYLAKSSIAGNVLWPGDSVEMLVQLQNTTDAEVLLDGTIEVISYGTRGRPGDIWIPEMFRIGRVGSIPFTISIGGGSYADLTIKPELPFRFGAYAIIIDLGRYGRQFITSCVRTFSAASGRIQYPSFCLDDHSNDVLQRLGVHAIRHGVEYKSSKSPDFEAWYQSERKRLQEYHAVELSVLIKMGAPGNYGEVHPLGMPRPWLDSAGVMQNTKSDMAWRPEYDEDFKKLVYRLAMEFGWPRGPINAFALWNEPWEGISISGWGADMIRYREIYTKMAEAVEEARRDGNVDILVGGCSSTSNALDKLFGDGSDAFIDRFDFCSIHYQGMAASSTIKKWVDRRSPRGRVKIWDTESWVANVDDRVAAVVATNRAAGYDRAMGVFWGNICEVVTTEVISGSGPYHSEVTHAWSVAAAIGATQHFIGERRFRELLFKNGLPWVSVFENPDNREDGTLVVIGDIGEEFGPENVLFRTARGIDELTRENVLRKKIRELHPERDEEEIRRLQKEIDKNEILRNASLSFQDGNGKFVAYDFYGNRVPSVDGLITVPLDGRGFFLRADGSKDSFKELTEAVRHSDVNGIEPLETIAYDFDRKIQRNTHLRLRLTNVLNRPVSGELCVAIPGITFSRPCQQLSFQANETRFVDIAIKNGRPALNNTYPLQIEFNAGRDGASYHEEHLHVNLISKRTINVDGDLNDWSGVLPQVIKDIGTTGTGLTEAAWFPFKKFDSAESQGIATGYLAYDNDNFYFATKVFDETPDSGMPRFETRDDDEFFYPDTSYVPFDGFRFGGGMKHNGLSFSVRWSGQLTIKHSGDYVFTVASSHPVRVLVDDKVIIDLSNAGNPSTEIALDKGAHHRLVVEFSKEWGEAAVKLTWKSSHFAEAILTSDDFSSGLKAEYYNGPAFNQLRKIRFDPAIDFKWNENEVPDAAFQVTPLVALQWPPGTRKYSYRKDPDLPFGNFQDHDNIQIAFNVLEEGEKDMYPFPPGTMKGFTNYQCTDYEYALNKVAERYGGGFEIWRSKVPGMPHKHFFPRQPSSPRDGPVKEGNLVVSHVGNTRIVEVAIPWNEIPHVKARLDMGHTIKFSFRVNNNTNNGCLELARHRSVSKINGSFKVDWKEHWANEVQFAFEK